MKTFAEWIVTECPEPPDSIAYDLAKKAWEASRHECITVCNEQAKEPECPERAEYCAQAMMAAPNASLSGLPLGKD